MKLWIKLLSLLACLLCLTGCGASASKQQSKGTAQITYITRNNRLDRITFAGGYLRSEPHAVPNNIVVSTLPGSEGVIYGRRMINKVEWAKVTTREGKTGWYCLEDGAALTSATASKELEVSSRNVRVTYPEVGGLADKVQNEINAEIENYMDAFNFVAGPVGNNLSCRITYNEHNLLSLMFEAPVIKNRTFATKEVNATAEWQKLLKYCYVSDLISDATPDALYAEVCDLQYAMVFDLTTGKRLKYQECLRAGYEDAGAKALQQASGQRLQEDNFCLWPDGRLALLVEHTGANPGRKLQYVAPEAVAPLATIIK